MNAQQQQGNFLRADSFLPCKFDGKKGDLASSHFSQYEDYVDKKGLNVQTAIYRRFRLTLTGEARDWLSGKAFITIAELKNNFVSYFDGEHTKEARRLKWQELAFRTNE